MDEVLAVDYKCPNLKKLVKASRMKYKIVVVTKRGEHGSSLHVLAYARCDCGDTHELSLYHESP